MITIRMDEKKLKLTVEGHATAEESRDYQLICTAASALTQGLAYSVSRSSGDMKSIEYRPEPGNLMLRVYPESKTESEIRQKFITYGDGMELLAKSHDCSVTMIRNGTRITAKEEKAG